MVPAESCVVGLEQSQVRHFIVGELKFLARQPLLLPGKDSRGSDRVDAVAVTNHQDQIPGFAFVGFDGEAGAKFALTQLEGGGCLRGCDRGGGPDEKKGPANSV